MDEFFFPKNRISPQFFVYEVPKNHRMKKSVCESQECYNEISNQQNAEMNELKIMENC